jgi:hypothetical protein
MRVGAIGSLVAVVTVPRRLSHNGAAVLHGYVASARHMIDIIAISLNITQGVDRLFPWWQNLSTT